METPRSVLLLGDTLDVASIGSGLRNRADLRLIAPGSPTPPDIVLLTDNDDEAGAVLEALRRYPQAAVVAVNVKTHRLTVWQATSAPAQTLQDVLDAMTHVATGSAGGFAG